MRSSSPHEGAAGGHLASLRPLLWCAPLGMAIWAAWSMLPASSAGQPAPQTAAAGPDVVTTAGEFHPHRRVVRLPVWRIPPTPRNRPVRPVRRPPPRPRPQEPAEAYRTLCVRLCDGYYSRSASRRGATASRRCQQVRATMPTGSRSTVRVLKPGRADRRHARPERQPHLSLPRPCCTARSTLRTAPAATIPPTKMPTRMTASSKARLERPEKCAQPRS